MKILKLIILSLLVAIATDKIVATKAITHKKRDKNWLKLKH